MLLRDNISRVRARRIRFLTREDKIHFSNRSCVVRLTYFHFEIRFRGDSYNLIFPNTMISVNNQSAIKATTANLNQEYTDVHCYYIPKNFDNAVKSKVGRNGRKKKQTIKNK